MAQFESAYTEFTNRNAAAVFIAAQKIDGLFKGKQHIEGHTYPFPVLFDESRAVTQSYGVYQLAGIDALNISRRAVFVVGGEGYIQWIAVSPHQFKAPAIDEVLRAIESGGKY
jgi:alkyl hydroperoxide reductase subunit AhpC